MKKYAIIVNGQSIFGVGDTVEETIADANEWFERKITESDLVMNINGSRYALVDGQAFITDDAGVIAEYATGMQDYLADD